jgi:hypothetical protein
VEIAKNLVFDVSGSLNILFDKDTAVPERTDCFVLRQFETLSSLLVIEGYSHALSTSTSRGFNHHWVADFVRNTKHVLNFNFTKEARHAAHT